MVSPNNDKAKEKHDQIDEKTKRVIPRINMRKWNAPVTGMIVDNDFTYTRKQTHLILSWTHKKEFCVVSSYSARW